MAGRKRLTLCVEGDGDREAAPTLIRHFITQHNAWQWLDLDPAPAVKVGHVVGLLRAREPSWPRLLQSTIRSHRPSGILLLLDGDVDLPKKEILCPGRLSRELCQVAREAGGGKMFSFAAVFALQEYESWLIAGVESLRGRALHDGRPGIRADAAAPERDLEGAPRDAKRWLKQHSACGYNSTTEQEPLTRLLLERPFPTRLAAMPSFQRLQRAVSRLIEGMRTGNHVLSPEPPP